ncbi:glutaminase A [uncultured Demequina sp.]|uniref:glutaminase A n=1 Tax=uncultured Demequina sp. TaxID=693499 RepID=UPI0025D58DB9|nr:glutaminase A [uncultured Demequina sp.]
MEPLGDLGVDEVAQLVHTGAMPERDDVTGVIDEAHARTIGLDDGEVATYIPELADADPRLFGISVVGTDGDHYAVGDADAAFSIQSISKAFVYALVCETRGHYAVREAVGVNNTGLPFNSVMAVELNDGHPMNPMVNAGAIATTAMVPAGSATERWEIIRRGLSAFAGHPLELDASVYHSEAATNQRNQALARLLESYGRMEEDPLEAVDVYTRQCSLVVDAHDLAVMGATLADGGVNPVTRERVVSEQVCRDVLAIMASAGMYERSGEWLFEIGLPAKSGVSGGIVAVAPGKGAVGAYSPRLDRAGNSVRGQRAVAYLSRTLGLNMFAAHDVGSTVKRSWT